MPNSQSPSPSYHVPSPTPSNELFFDAPEMPCADPANLYASATPAEAESAGSQLPLLPIPNVWGDPDQAPFTCPLCPRTFQYRKNCASHIATHDEPGEEKNFKCPLCPRIFNRRHNREVHIRTHDYDAAHQYPCEICDKKFTRRHDAQRHHERYHTGARAPAKFPSLPVLPVRGSTPLRPTRAQASPRTFPVAMSSTRGPSRARQEDSSDEAEDSLESRRRVVKPLARRSLCLFIGQQEAHDKGSCDCFQTGGDE
jgi:uncharacterized Zn-finger protein